VLHPNHINLVLASVDALRAELTSLYANEAALRAELSELRQTDWKAMAAEFSNSCEYYTGLLDACGVSIGAAAYTSDDGSVQDSVLRAKVPELVARLVIELQAAHQQARSMAGELTLNTERINALQQTLGVTQQDLHAVAAMEKIRSERYVTLLAEANQEIERQGRIIDSI
jgi:hypothetical protein